MRVERYRASNKTRWFGKGGLRRGEKTCFYTDDTTLFEASHSDSNVNGDVWRVYTGVCSVTDIGAADRVVVFFFLYHGSPCQMS